MSLEAAIEGLTAAIKENTAAMRELEAKVDGPAEEKPAEKPKKSSNKKSAAKAEQPKEDPKAEKEPATEPDAVDKKTLTAKIIAVAKEKGREAAANLLAEYGATKVPELEESVYGEVYAKAEELLA